MKVEIVINDALVDMVSAGFDAGIRFGETIAADMIAVPIGPRHRFAVVGSPAYFKKYKPPATPRDLKGLPCIRYRFASGTLYRWEFERGGIEVDIDVEGPLTLSEQDLMVDAALDGVGLAFVFEAQVEELIARGRLLRVLADWCPAYPGFFLYYSEPPPASGGAARLCRFCQDAGVTGFATNGRNEEAWRQPLMRPAQFPLNTALRFSIKACTASR